MTMQRIISKSRLDAFASVFVTLHPHETSALLHSSSCFFFILSAYFVVLPLRDEGAISLGLSKLPGLFVGSLILTLIAAPVSTLIFSLPNLSKAKALVLIHRFFSVSLLVFFLLWQSSSIGYLSKLESVSHLESLDAVSSNAKEDPKAAVDQGSTANSADWGDHGWFYVSVRMGFFLWVALLNLITISSTWARVIDVMDSESGSRLFGFIGAGATLGQLFGSLFAAGMAFLGPYLLLFAACLMELAAQSSKGIYKEIPRRPEELPPLRKADSDPRSGADGQTAPAAKVPSPRSSTSIVKPHLWAILDGLRLIFSSNYLLSVSLFLWLSAVVSSFFYFQGHILSVAGITVAICSAPFIAFSNMIAIAIWPTWVTVAISETIRKVVTYVVTRPGRELLFTVVSQEEKYKAKRLGDASAAGLYKLLFSTLHGRTSTVSLYALPVCLLWIATAFHLGRRQAQLAKLSINPTS
ncbi:ADP,ATP carrier protein [Citrus sinensis]|nr:ADP,ATP carrier protein [Citrus sinensis]